MAHLRCESLVALLFPPKSLFLRTVGTVSNLLRLGGLRGAELAAGVEIRPAQDNEIAAALKLVVPGTGGRLDAAQLAEFAQVASAHRRDAGGMWIAVVDGKIQSAALPIISPGRTMLIIPPADVRTPARQAMAQQLISQICRQAAAEGVHLAQTLLEPGRGEVHALLTVCGFTKLAELLYLQAAIRRPIEPPPLPLGYHLATYDEGMHAQFSHVILASYLHSQDCPLLNGMRHSDDILAGHRATGEFDPSLWHLLTVHNTAAAVLLLSRIPRTRGMELIYLGLTPEARGRGIGDLLMRVALAAAHARQCEHLSLAVDAVNLPALRLYWRHGMQAVGRKLAMLKDLRAAASE